jgi:hypothetical protein
MADPQAVELLDRSLEQLGAGNAPAGESYLNAEMRRLARLPLKQLRLEDLRLLIGQGVGLRFLVPMAIDHLGAHPLASGDFYSGDLLKQVTEVDESFWRNRPELRGRLVTALDGALARIAKTRAPVELEHELSASLKRHQAALREAV